MINISSNQIDEIIFMEGSKRQKISEDTDRISQLPDYILLEILSFLPTKTAVATSVLATRWKYLWKSLHNLYFFNGWSPTHTSNVQQFSDFINKIMHQHDVSNILQFCLGCKELVATHFHSWMSILVSRNVQDIVISIQNPHRLLFPPCFFSCRSLRTLSVDVGHTIDIPSTISMPLLEDLRLQCVGFSVKQAGLEVSLNFPMLEKLVLQKCLWVDVKIVHVYAPILKMLEILDCDEIGILDCELKVYAENIQQFKLGSYFPYRYSIHHGSLYAAFINITSTHVTFPRVSSLFEEISSVRGIGITASTIKTMSYQEVSSHIVALSNLIYLSVIPGLAYAEIDDRQMICVLSNMPKLVSISFPNGLCDFTVRGRRRRQRRTPGNFLSNLRLVDIGDFSGNNDELWFIKFLLKKAQELLQISVKLGGSQWQNFSEKEKEKITKQLQKLGRSSNCRIKIT